MNHPHGSSEKMRKICFQEQFSEAKNYHEERNEDTCDCLNDECEPTVKIDGLIFFSYVQGTK